MRRWRITYLPLSLHPRVTEWVFQGSEFDLNEYLANNHGCPCPDCKDMDWHESAQACEYEIKELDVDD